MNVILKLDAEGNPYIKLPNEDNSAEEEIMKYFKLRAESQGMKLIKNKSITGYDYFEIHIDDCDKERN